MKIESINVTAMKNVLTASFGPEATEVIEKLYGLTNEAMHEGYTAGYAEADMAGFKRGYQEAEKASEETMQTEWEKGYEKGYDDVLIEREHSSRAQWDEGFQTGWEVAEAGWARGYDAGYEDAKAEYFVESLKAQPALQGNCAALDAEYKRLDDAYNEFCVDAQHWTTLESEATFDEYSRPEAQALPTDDEDYLPFPSQERFRPN